MTIIPQDATPQKQCKGECKRLLPATSVYFHVGNDQYGLYHTCKACRKLLNQANAANAKAYNQQYYQTHKDEIIISTQQYVQSHREQRRAYEIEYAQTHREGHRQACKKYDKTHPEQVRMHNTRHRARIKGIPGKHTAKDIENQYQRQKGGCYYCGKKLGTGKRAFHVDHIIPITRGGTNNPDNLVIACQPCNSSKNNKLPHEWPEGGRLL